MLFLQHFHNNFEVIDCYLLLLMGKKKKKKKKKNSSRFKLKPITTLPI